MAQQPPSQSDGQIAVSELLDGERFRWQDAVWEADVKQGHVVAWREGGFGARAVFYDPVTAAKAGELSWATRVESLR